MFSMKTLGKIGAGVALAFLTASWVVHDVRADDANDSRRMASEAACVISKANNAFGFELFKRLHREGGNTVFSPTSVGAALQMTSRGAKGETLAEMVQGLRPFPTTPPTPPASEADAGLLDHS
jgi:serine protease inhibitor